MFVRDPENQDEVSSNTRGFRWDQQFIRRIGSFICEEKIDEDTNRHDHR